MPENGFLPSKVHSEYIDYLASGLEKTKVNYLLVSSIVINSFHLCISVCF